MPSDQDEVPAGAVIAAMELVKGLGSDENVMPGDALLSLIRDPSVGPEELTQGFALLVGSFMHMLDSPMDLVPPLIRKLRGAGVGTGRGAADDGWSVDGCRVGSVTVGLTLCGGLRYLDRRSLGGARLGLHRMAARRRSRLRGR
jgi:hypothetical protein